MSKDKKAIFKPKAQEVAPIDDKYSQKEVAAAEQLVQSEEKDKKMSAVQTASAIWTLICTLYSIVSVCMFVAKKWVDSTYTYILIPLLAVLVIVFIVLVVLTFKDKKKLKTSIKTYKKILGIFKAFVNVFFLVLTAVSMAGLATGETSLVKWIVFGATFLVALVQLALKITKFVMKQVRVAVGKKYKVEVQRFVDGKKKRKTVADSVQEHGYKQ